MNTNLLPAPGSHFISLQQGINMTALYRSEKEGILAKDYQNKDILPICETFVRADIDVLLAKQDCAAIRIYFGMDDQLKTKLIIVAVNEQGEDILSINSVAGESSATDAGDIIEEGHRCPPACPPPSPLNS